MKRPTIQDALDYCLLNPDRLSTEDLLARFPEYREQLQPLIAVAHDVRRQGYAPPVAAERRAAIKERVLDAAAARNVAQPYVGSTNGRAHPVLPVEDAAPKARGERKGFSLPALHLPRLEMPRLHAPAWGFVGALVILVAVVWFASASSLPGNPLYQVKLASENIQVAFAGSPTDKVRVHTDIAASRLHDLGAMQAQGKLHEAGPALENFNHHFDAGVAVWQETTGDEHVEVAKVLYTSGEASKRTLERLDAGLVLVPDGVRADVQAAITTVFQIRVAASQALQAANIDPTTLPVPNIQLPAVAAVTPRATVGGQPGVAPAPVSAATAIAAATRTSVVAVARTAIAAGAVSNPTAATAALTVLAGGNPTQIASAQQTMVVAAASPALPGTPVRTVTQVVAGIAATPTADRPTPPVRTRTRTPRPGITPPAQPTAGRPPTDTPIPVPPAPTGTDTPVPPSATPEPTNRATSSPTHTPLPSYTPTLMPTPSKTPTPEPTASVCDLEVTVMDASCASEDCVDWSASVYNPGSGIAVAAWAAELQISIGQGGFVVVATEEGSGYFGPGETALDGTICYAFPPNTTRMKVRVSLEGPGVGCSPQGATSAMDPCGSPPATQEPRPTREPRETNTPRPRNTQSPRETATPNPLDAR